MATFKDHLIDIYLYIGNHRVNDGIEDYISIVRDIFCKNNLDLELTDDLTKTNSVYIIIDEFTNYFRNIQIKNIDKSSKIIFIATEFVEKKLLFETFNYYSGIDRYFYTPFVTIFFKLQRNDFGRVNTKDIISALISLPPVLLILLLKYIYYVIKKKNITGFLRKELDYMHYFIYLHMRYLGLCSMIDIADMVLVPHSQIGIKMKTSRNCKSEKKVFEFFPDFSKVDFTDFFKGKLIAKTNGMMITGSITSHRQKWIEKVNKKILIYGLFDMVNVQSYSFEDKRKSNRLFSLHPVQIKGWKYSSPTRIYRAIAKDNTIPIITQLNNDHIIENLCYLLDLDRMYDLVELVDSPESVREYWIGITQTYQAKAEVENTKLIDAIENL